MNNMTTNPSITTEQISSAHDYAQKVLTRPSVFDYTNYRIYLQDFYQYLKAKNPSYSKTAFIKQTGMNGNCRGYFGLILSNKRNLASQMVVGFSHALKLEGREALYFENLVYYNQATSEKDKTYYFERLSKYVKGNRKAYELLKSQYNYFNKWYLVAIRELVALDNFIEDESWIVRKLRKAITKLEAREAINDLLTLGLIQRNEDGKLIQREELVIFSDNSPKFSIINKFHTQMLERAKETIESDDYENRSSSCVVLSTNQDNFIQIRDEIKIFRDMILKKYGTKAKKTDCVLNLGIQLFHITTIEQDHQK